MSDLSEALVSAAVDAHTTRPITEFDTLESEVRTVLSAAFLEVDRHGYMIVNRHSGIYPKQLADEINTKGVQS